ncbi:MAG: hypothetical protein IJ928_12040 [Prevotella sp.]|nr:hypothetical protein [Prevotella sp.]
MLDFIERVPTEVTNPITLLENDINEAWYSLDGCRLNGQPKAKGIYIHNGRKVVVKGAF